MFGLLFRLQQALHAAGTCEILQFIRVWLASHQCIILRLPLPSLYFISVPLQGPEPQPQQNSKRRMRQFVKGILIFSLFTTRPLFSFVL